MFNIFVKNLVSIDTRKVPLQEAAKHIYKKVIFCIDHIYVYQLFWCCMFEKYQ